MSPARQQWCSCLTVHCTGQAALHHLQQCFYCYFITLLYLFETFILSLELPLLILLSLLKNLKHK